MSGFKPGLWVNISVFILNIYRECSISSECGAVRKQKVGPGGVAQWIECWTVNQKKTKG